ncbi:tetratricopeptide repeat protein [Pseudomaricurvus alkylphenolicus]|uniref:tetratricopeptide repeat protein n=1 Tax=Pseudomaricurvus alkylphenolicus TaxID=1306991 RepID=UPI00142276D6|nr:tetratricopeptide repeat protein [Pseudomaricurvus alkylphenolicus]
MTAHLTEEEQLEALKRWWAENGKSTVFGVILAVGGYLGWEGWQDHQRTQAETASASYQNLVEALAIDPASELTEEQTATVNHLAEALKSDHANSLYASQAALFLARLAVERDDLEGAAAELQWVLDQKPDAALDKLTRSRLARVKMDLKQYDQALALVADKDSGVFKAIFAEIRGDALLAKGDSGQARAAYQLALDNLTEESQGRSQLLQMKINDLKTAAEGENS